jgi:hypothetical protein
VKGYVEIVQHVEGVEGGFNERSDSTISMSEAFNEK